jgi:integrase
LKPKHYDAADMPLGTVLTRYYEQYARNIASEEAQRHALVHWLDFWGPATIADLTIERQEEFVAWLKAGGSKQERPFRNSYVSRVLSVGRAAIRRAWKRGEITSVPFIIDEPDRSDRKKPYRLDRSEMRRFLMTVQEWPHLFTLSMIMLNTLARPEAALALSPAQVQLDDRLVYLNPNGRKQTKKHRPTVPLTETLLPFLRAADVPAFVLWNGKPIKSVKKTFALAVERAGLSSEITPYSLRHTMAKELRKRGVPAWEVKGLLGHRVPGATEDYAEFAPDYLSQGREAIDAYFKELNLSYTVPTPDYVSVACQLLDDGFFGEVDFATKSVGQMVGVTGIEPVTPTMST